MSYVGQKLRTKISKQAKNRCGYCLGEQQYIFAPLEIEHILPESLGGKTEEENLWLACRFCNGYKGTQTHGVDPLTKKRSKLFNPRRQKWNRHFKLSEDKTEIIGKTICGRATVDALQMNNEAQTSVRRNWIEVGWFPPDDL